MTNEEMLEKMRGAELAVRAERQGYVIKDAAIEQKKASAIFLLNIHGIITDGEDRKARQHLLKKIKFYEVGHDPAERRALNNNRSKTT